MQQEDNKGIIERTDKKKELTVPWKKHEKQSKSQTKVYKAQHRKAEKTILN